MCSEQMFWEMKKIVLTIAFALAGIAFANANQEEATRANFVDGKEILPVAQDSVERTPVTWENLPTGIQDALSSEQYAGWDFSAAAHVAPEKGEAYYEISLVKKGEETPRIVKMDADGTLKKGGISPPSRII